MGGINSYCIGRCTKADECPENHLPLPKRIGGHKRNLSSTFTQLNSWDTQQPKPEPADLLNINTASEEELMTLPGINRATASSVVKYRKEIGLFRRIEDIVVVSGIGGDKFEVIKDEITVGSVRPGGAGVAGLGPGGDAGLLGANGAAGGPEGGRRRRVCLNSANMFQLMQLGGVNQMLAERIVSHREKHGPFPTLDALLRVKGVDTCLLATLRHKLVLQPSTSPAASSSPSSRKSSAQPLAPPLPSASPQPSSGADSAVVFSADTPAVAGHRRSASQQLRAPDTLSQLSRLSEMFSPSQLDLISQLRPLSQRVVRPAPANPLDPGLPFRRHGKEVVRVAAWNLERLGTDKMGNPGVREVVCLTLWENSISLLAVQEVSDPEALRLLCAELNCPSLPNTRRWAGHRGQWAYEVSAPTGRGFQGAEHQALVWDTSRGLRLQRLGLLEPRAGPEARAFTRSPVVAHVALAERPWELLLVGVHLKARRLSREPGDDARTRAEVDCLPLVAQAIDDAVAGAQDMDVAVVGDFNLGPDAANFDPLRDHGFANLIGPEQPTNVAGTRCLDNVWYRAGAPAADHERAFTGHCGVIRRGLEHPFIPGGRGRGNWGWNGVPSDHCPVWVEFFTG